MKIMMISGSRNKEGQTAQATDAVLKGAVAGGAQIEWAYLPHLKIERCRQCDDNGWGICREVGECVIKDDFADLVRKIRRADVVLFATPVYFGDLSESLRAFTDRLRRICRTDVGQLGIQGKHAVGVCVAGGGGGGAPECCVSLKRVLGHCGFDVIDMVPVRRQNLKEKLPGLELLGQWLAKR